MKRIIFSWILLFGITNYFHGQVISIKINEKGKSGYVDANDNEILPCKYDATYPFENGMGKVMKGDKYGLVDKNGNFVVQTKWDELNYDEANNLYRVKSGKNYGLLDGSGNLLVKAQYLYISPFNCYGKALVAKGGKIIVDNTGKRNMLLGSAFGVINADGSEAIPAKHKGLFEFTLESSEKPYVEGKRLELRTWYVGDTLSTDCKYIGFGKNPSIISNAGILDESGTIIVPMKTAERVFMPCNGMVRWYNTVSKKKFDIGYYNIETKKKQKLQTINGQISDTDYWTHSDFMNDIAAVTMNGSWIFIDKQGKTVKEGYKDICKGATCGIWQAKRSDGTIDYFDQTGSSVFVGLGYTDVFFPRNQKGTDFNYLGAEKNGRWGLIDKTGNEVLPFEYDKVTDCRYGYIPVQKGRKWGIISLKNDIVVPTAYEDITSVTEPNPNTVYVNKSDNLWYVYNINKRQDVGRGYVSTGNFADGIAWARPANMKVENNYLNQVLTGSKIIDEKDFGIVINEEGQELIKTPIPTKYIAEVRNLLKKNNSHVLNQSEVKRLLLNLSKYLRHYPMNDIIAESEWDY